MKTHSKSSTAPHTLLISALEGAWEIKTRPRPSCPRESFLVPILQEAVWTPTKFCTDVEKRKSLAPTRVRTSNRPAHSDSLWICYISVYISNLFVLCW